MPDRNPLLAPCFHGEVGGMIVGRYRGAPVQNLPGV